MKELREEKLESICKNYINGNITDARKQINKLNKLQIANFIMRSSRYGLKKHQAYTQVIFAIEGDY